MKYQMYFSKRNVVIKLIMPNTNMIYEHTGFDNFLEEQYQEDEESNFRFFCAEPRLTKTRMIQTFLQESLEELISFADYNSAVITFDEPEYLKFEFEENMNL